MSPAETKSPSTTRLRLSSLGLLRYRRQTEAMGARRREKEAKLLQKPPAEVGDRDTPICKRDAASCIRNQDSSYDKLHVDTEDEPILRDAVIKKGTGLRRGVLTRFGRVPVQGYNYWW